MADRTARSFGMAARGSLGQPRYIAEPGEHAAGVAGAGIAALAAAPRRWLVLGWQPARALGGTGGGISTALAAGAAGPIAAWRTRRQPRGPDDCRWAR